MADVKRTVDAVWRIESARLIAGLTRIVRDVGLAEDLAQDALVAALERWPESGVPDNPGAWLMATAKHRAIDLLRRKTLVERKHDELGHELEAQQATTVAALDATIGIVAVARAAAAAGCGPPLVTMISTFARTRSADNAGKRGASSSAQRYSICRFRPSA